MDREQHARERAGRLSSSRAAAALLRRNPKTWNTLLRDLWDEEKMVSDFTRENRPGTAFHHGQEHEDCAIAKFWELYPFCTIEDPKLVRFHDEESPLYPWVITSPDRKVVVHSGLVRPYPLEAKCPMLEERWESYKQCKKRNQFPDEHIAQCQWHSWVMGAKGTSLIIWWEGELLEFYLPRSQAIHETFEEHALMFVPHLESGQPFEEATDDEVNSMLEGLI